MNALIYLFVNQIKGRYGGLKSKPDAVAVAPGIMNIVVGTGNTRESGGPSSNQILSSTSVIVVGAVKVVPATVAKGNRGGGTSVPSIEAVGLVVLGKAGNPVEGKGVKKGFRNEEVENGVEKVNGENGTKFTFDIGDQNGLKNGLKVCA